MNRKYEKECECTVEYILPDYLGDIKRVLFANARVIGDEKFVGEDGIESSGNVNFSLIYATGEGNLSEIDVSGDFNTVFNIDMEGYKNSILECCVNSFNYRVVGPRKVSLKAKILNSLEYSSSAESSLQNFEGAEVQSVELEKYCAVFASKRENEYNEELYVNENLGTNIEIISSFGSVKIDSTEPLENAVEIKGEYIIGAILRESENNIFVVRKSIPFTEMVDFEGIDETVTAMSTGSINSLNIAMADGESCRLNVSFTSDLNAKACKNERETVITDVYYKNYNTVTEYVPVSNNSLLKMSQSLVNLPFSIEYERLGVNELRDVLRMNAQIQNYEVRAKQNSIEICGNVAFSGIACEINDAGNVDYFPIKSVEEFKLERPVGIEIREENKIEVRLNACDCEYVIGNNAIEVTLTLDVAEQIFESRTVEAIKSAEKSGDEYKNDASVYTVYFTSDDESLFEIAKKFNTTREKLARDNNLSEETVFGVSKSLPKRLIIR